MLPQPADATAALPPDQKKPVIPRHPGLVTPSNRVAPCPADDDAPAAGGEFPFFTFTQALSLKHRKRSKLSRSVRTFWILTPLSALTALASLVASFCTTDWLRTLERMPNDNRTVLWGPDKSPEYLNKHTRSGLFHMCHTKRKSIFLRALVTAKALGQKCVSIKKVE